MGDDTTRSRERPADGLESMRAPNEKLQSANDELSQLSSDLQNLLRVTDIGTLFVDHSLRIGRFTPRVGEMFDIRLTDRGRPLADITHRLGYGGMLDDARRVLDTLMPAEREVETESGRWNLIRILPCRTVEDRIEGVVITLVDITSLKRAEAALRASEERYRALFESMDEAYAVVELIADAEGRWSDFRFLEVNPAFMQHTGMPFPVGRTATELLGTPNPRWVELYGRAAETGESIRAEESEPVLGRTFDLNIFRLGGPGSRRVAVLFRNITERKRAEAAMEWVSAAEARELLRRRLLEAEEAERRRLARELHDEAGQHLTALGLGLQSLSDVVAPGSEADQRASQLRALVATMGRELHAIAVRLRPKALDDFGLEQAIAAYVEEWSRQTGIAVDVHADPEPVRLSTAIESAVYRIVQEALTNVAKHSGATHAGVVVERHDGQVVAIVEDDGRGFDTSAPPADAIEGLGLIGIRERAELLGGTVEVESTPGGGTTVFARIPIEIPSGGAGGA